METSDWRDDEGTEAVTVLFLSLDLVLLQLAAGRLVVHVPFVAVDAGFN